MIFTYASNALANLNLAPPIVSVVASLSDAVAMFRPVQGMMIGSSSTTSDQLNELRKA